MGRKPYSAYHPGSFQITVSLGMAKTQTHQASCLDELQHQAGRAMDRAQQSGRNLTVAEHGEAEERR